VKKDRKARRRGAAPAQLVLFKPRGGKRHGAGRRPKGARPGASHEARPALHERHPVHVTLRVASELGSLRRRAAYHAIRQATLTAAMRGSMRIVHLSIQRTHIHLLVEAANQRALSQGMQSFQVSAAKHLNAAVGKMNRGPRRRGTVFPDRYHARIITSPTQARHSLAYLLCNWRHHEEDRAAPMNEWKIDWFSSAAMFPDWAEYGEDEWHLWQGPSSYDPLFVFRARTWLLAEGWKKHSMTISCWEVPSKRT
jgi:REP element-mobilizing transposase RayT